MTPGLKVVKPRGSVSTKEDLKGFESSEPTKILEAALRRGVKRMEYRLDDEEWQDDPEDESRAEAGVRDAGRKSLEMAGRHEVLQSGRLII